MSVFTFWMRTVMVQLLSGNVSVRLTSLFMEDRFQQWLVGFVVGTLTYVTIVLGAVPRGAGEERTPHLSVAVAVLVGMGSVITILIAVRNAVRSMDLGRLVHRLTVDNLERLDATFVPPAETHSPPFRSFVGKRICSQRIGWVGRIDEDRLLRAIPEDGVLQLHVRPGSFVFDDAPVATVPSGSDEGTIRETVEVTDTQSFGRDPRFDLQMLTDVGEQALALNAPDSTTAYEVIAHLRPVLAEILLRDPRSWVTDDGDGRVVVREEYLTHDQVIRDTVGRLRRGAAPYPPVACELLRTVGGLHPRLRAAGRERLGALLEGEAESLVHDLRDSVRNERDRNGVEETAVGEGLLGREMSAAC